MLLIRLLPAPPKRWGGTDDSFILARPRRGGIPADRRGLHRIHSGGGDMKSIAWAIMFIGIIFSNTAENYIAGRHGLTNFQGFSALVALIGFLVSVYL